MRHAFRHAGFLSAMLRCDDAGSIYHVCSVHFSPLCLFNILCFSWSPFWLLDTNTQTHDARRTFKQVETSQTYNTEFFASCRILFRNFSLGNEKPPFRCSAIGDLSCQLRLAVHCGCILVVNMAPAGLLLKSSPEHPWPLRKNTGSCIHTWLGVWMPLNVLMICSLF